MQVYFSTPTIVADKTNTLVLSTTIDAAILESSLSAIDAMRYKPATAGDFWPINYMTLEGNGYTLVKHDQKSKVW